MAEARAVGLTKDSGWEIGVSALTRTPKGEGSLVGRGPTKPAGARPTSWTGP
jgi:hypothetical protein